MGAWIEILTKSKQINTVSVAPHVGAWIEITSSLKSMTGYGVAPHVGAWIEIEMLSTKSEEKRSHPTWVRGLKLIEEACSTISASSHPTWVRGLK